MTDRTVARILVTAQMTLVGIVVATAWIHGAGRFTSAGWTVALAGFALMGWSGVVLGPGLTASPLPNQRVELRTTGPYRLMRHPIYTGLLVAALGAVVWSGGWMTAVAWLQLAVVLVRKARWEEHHLAAAFPGWPEYAARTGRFVPWWR